MRTHLTLALLVIGVCSSGVAADWPTYLHDNSRSGVTDERLEAPLVPVWVFEPIVPPDPAWTTPAKEAARVRFDDAYHVVVKDGQVYFGSSGDNKVYALEAKTGKIVWEFFTAGPVRLAPTAWKDKLYFGSDDGFVYCLRAATGELVWRARVAYSAERVIGHGRIISLWPVRTGVVVQDGIAYFGAGIFPSESIYVCAADAETGSFLWRNDVSGERGPEQQYDGISPQGYLLASSDNLFVPSGRSMPAVYDLSTGGFRYYLRPGGKVGGTYAILSGGDLIAGVNAQKTYDQKTGETAKDAGYAWSPAHRLIVSGNVSYSLGDHHLSALDRGGYKVVLEERNKVAAERGEVQKQLRTDYRARYRLDKESPEYQTKYDELTTKVDEQYAKLKVLEAAQKKVEGKAFRWERENDLRDSMILAGDLLFAGGDRRVTAVKATSGEWVWTGDVDGRASGLAAADGRLYVSTNTGKIHCFAQGKPRYVRNVVRAGVQPAPFADDELTRVYGEAARKIVEDTGVVRGFCLVLGAGEGRLAVELARRTDLIIYGVDPDPEAVARARLAVDRAGLYGHRVTIDVGSLHDLPYPDYFANLIVSDELITAGRLDASPPEMLRVLRPAGGTAYLGQPAQAAVGNGRLDRRALSTWLAASGSDTAPVFSGAAGYWALLTRPELPGAGSWTHEYADPGNSANSGDELVRAPLGVLWFGRPGPEAALERHARAAAPLSREGRLFVEGENLVQAFDIYNGMHLWEREIPGAVRARVDVDGSNFAVTERGLFVATRDQVLRLDQETGRTIQSYSMPADPEGRQRRWGVLYCVGDTLFGSSAEPLLEEYGARWQNKSPDPYDNLKDYQRFNAGGGMWRYMQRWPDWGREDTWQGAMTSRMIASESLFAVDVETGVVRWIYEGEIGHSTISVGDGKVFFADRKVSEAEKNAAVQKRRARFGRLTYEEEGKDYSEEYDVRHLVAVNYKTGKVEWKRALDLTGSGGDRLGTTFYKGRLFVYGHYSNHDGAAFKKGGLKWRRVTVVSGNDGYVFWSKELNYLRRPFLMGQHLIIEPRACDIETGEYITRTHPVSGEEVPWEFKRGGHSCGVSTGSANTFFLRSDSINYYDYEKDQGMLPFGGTRAGCWINMITAGGVALFPEASAGCTCSFPIRSTIVMAPKRQDRAWSVYISPGSMLPVKTWSINLGAPGDRKDAEGRVWFGYPRLGVGYGMKFSLDEKIEKRMGFYANAWDAAPIENTDKPWVYASGVRGAFSCALTLLGEESEPREYSVRLGFCEPEHDEAGKRVFGLKLQGKVVVEDFDIAGEGGGKNVAVFKEVRDVEIIDALAIELVSRGEEGVKSAAPLLSSIEVWR